MAENREKYLHTHYAFFYHYCKGEYEMKVPRFSFIKLLFPVRWIYIPLIAIWTYASFFSPYAHSDSILSAIIIYSIIFFTPILIIEFILFHKRLHKTNNKVNVTSPSVNSANETSIVYEQKIECPLCNSQTTQITDEDVPLLIQKGLQHAIERENTSNNPSLHRTAKEEDLCFQFMSNHSHEIQKYTNAFKDCYRSAFSEEDINQKIILLEKTIKLYEKAKTWFYQTKGGMIYFQDYYEYLHNSRTECFSYIESVHNYLKECLNERDYVIPQIFCLIDSSPEGFLQKNIYEHIPDVPKSDIQRIIRELEAKHIIIKTKSGNSYLLQKK